jgi:hypothetical protein
MIAVLSKETKEGGIIIQQNYNRVIYSDTNGHQRKKHDTAGESFRLRHSTMSFHYASICFAIMLLLLLLPPLGAARVRRLLESDQDSRQARNKVK